MPKKPKKPKRIKKPTLKQLKHKADEVFSQYIRQKYANSDGYVSCITCGVFKPVKEMQCGHYFTRGRLSIRFHEKNCHPQCVTCNVFKKGNYPSYASFMYRTYGQQFMDELEAESRKLVKYSLSDYEQMIQEFEQKTEELKK